MSKTNTNTNSTPTNNTLNIISTGTKIEGTITTEGDIRVDGVVEGDIHLSGKLVIGQKGLIKGNVECLNADISGTLDGNIKVKEFLLINSTSIVKGQIAMGKLAIEPGARFTGQSSMNTQGE